MSNKGVLVVVSGFSGAGKGTVIKKLLSEHEGYSLSVSATTRKMREGEVDKKDYFFKTREEFLEMIDKNQLIEYAEYVGNFYGTPKSYVEERLKAGDNVILEIEIQGALNIKRMYEDAVLIFITPPGAKDLHERLSKRGTETEEVIKKRICRASEEAPIAKEYDYLVVNDDIDRCVEELHEIISCERLKVSRNICTIDRIVDELNAYRKEI